MAQNRMSRTGRNQFFNRLQRMRVFARKADRYHHDTSRFTNMLDQMAPTVRRDTFKHSMGL